MSTTSPPVPTAVGHRTRALLWGNVAAQVAIVVTGGLVRLTGSGLGCPTWPRCTGSSLVPVRDQVEGLHSLVEFGNRLLTFVLVVVAVASLVAVVRHQPRRRPLAVLAALVLAGIPAQAVLGGVTVLVDLHPAAVGSHFLLSMVVVAAAVVLAVRAAEPGDEPVRVLVRRELRGLSVALTGLAVVLVTLGTVVTGSGPHAGDAQARRYDLDVRSVAWLHADLVILFLGLSVAFWLGARLTDAPPRATRAGAWLVGLCVVQGAVGYLQYFTGVPALLVATHVLGACLVWVATLLAQLSTRQRGGAPQASDAAPVSLST